MGDGQTQEENLDSCSMSVKRALRLFKHFIVKIPIAESPSFRTLPKIDAALRPTPLPYLSLSSSSFLGSKFNCCSLLLCSNGDSHGGEWRMETY